MKIAIVIEDLPVRPSKVSEKEVAEIFGGCGQTGDFCEKDKDCCSTGKCRHSAYWTGNVSSIWKMEHHESFCIQVPSGE